MSQSERATPARPIVTVGVVAINGQGEICLIERARAPMAGQISIPGGKLEFGETLHDGARREMAEETGLEIEIGGLIDVVDGIFGSQHYVMVDYWARIIGGNLFASSDAARAFFVSRAGLESLKLWQPTRTIIETGHQSWLKANS